MILAYLSIQLPMLEKKKLMECRMFDSILHLTQWLLQRMLFASICVCVHLSMTIPYPHCMHLGFRIFIKLDLLSVILDGFFNLMWESQQCFLDAAG